MVVDVIFVNASWHEGYNRSGRWGGRTISMSQNPPLNMLYSASALRRVGYTVAVIDALAERLTDSQLITRVMEYDPKIAIVDTNCASISMDLKCAKLLKTVCKVERVGLCGFMATADHKSLLIQNDFIDFCLLGEYDYTVIELLNKKYWKHVDGVSYRDWLGLHFGKKNAYVENMDALPYPAYDLVNTNLYDELIIMKRPFVQTLDSRGCPFTCTFCLSEVMYGKSWRYMSAKRVVDEMEYWQQQGIKEVFWDGETFTVNKKRVFEICELIKERGLSISWSCLGRADTVAPKMLEVMGDANCVLIRYGFESGCQEILNFINKSYFVHDIVNASKWSRDAGIKVHGAWMFVPPIETDKSINQTVSLAKKTCDTAQFTVCTPYYGTEYYNICDKNGWLLSDDWRDFLASDKSVVESPVDLSKAVQEAYKSFYLRPSYLFKTLWQELRKGTVRKSFDVAMRVIGLKKYWGDT